MPLSVDSTSAEQAPPPSPVAALLGALRRATAPVWVLLAGAMLALLGTQMPQADAPRWVADGLSQQDHLSIASTGLNHLASSLPALLWWLAAVAVVAVRIPAGWSSAATPAKVSAAAWLVAASCWAGWSLWTAEAQPAVWMDVGVGDDPPAAKGWVLDGGKLSPAPGRYAGRCQPGLGNSRELECELESPAGSAQVHLAPGRPDLRRGWQYTWIGKSPEVASPRFTFVGQVAAAAGGRGQALAGTSQLDLQAGRAVDAPSLRSRWIPTVTSMAGPAVLVAGEGWTASWWTSPLLSGGGAAQAGVRVAERVRIQIAPVSWAGHLWWLALLALTVAALAGAPRRRT